MSCHVAQLLIVLEYTLHFMEYATPPHIHPMSRNITACDQFYQVFPHVKTASDKCWGEKAWVQLRAVKDGSKLYLFGVHSRRSKVITACACVNQLYIKGCCINCDYITLVFELPRKRADWMRSK